MYEDEYAEDIIERYSDMPFIQRVMRDTEDFPKYTSEIMNFGATFQTLSYGPRNSWNAWEAPLRKFFQVGKLELDDGDAKILENELEGKEEKETVESAEPIRPIHGMILFFELYKLERDIIFFKAHSYITHALLYGDGRAGVTFIRNFINNKLGVFGAVAVLSTPDKPIAGKSKKNAWKVPKIFPVVLKKPKKKEFDDALQIKIAKLYPSYSMFDQLMDGKGLTLQNLRFKVKEILEEIEDAYYGYDVSAIRNGWKSNVTDEQLKLVEFRLMLLFFIGVKEVQDKMIKEDQFFKKVKEQFDLVESTGTLFFYDDSYPETVKQFMKKEKIISFSKATIRQSYELTKEERKKSENNFVKLLLDFETHIGVKNVFTKGRGLAS